MKGTERPAESTWDAREGRVAGFFFFLDYGSSKPLLPSIGQE